MQPIKLSELLKELAIELGHYQPTGDTMNTELNALAAVVRKATETAPHDANAAAIADHIAAAILAAGWTKPEASDD